MKKVNLCILLWGLLSSMPASGQSKFFSERQQKEKVQQELTYYREQAKQGDAKAKIRVKRALELLHILENGGLDTFARTRASENNIYTDTICNVNYSYNPEDGTAMVVSSDGNENVNILESFTVNGRTYTVTSIDRDAFVFSSKMLSIQIPQSIISIDEDAFSYNRNVSNIKVATGNPVFDSRDNCNAIINTETNTLIWGCKGTIIPNGIVSIGSYAFSGFESPENPIFPESVEKIGYFAFAQCDNLKELHIPATITDIDRRNPFWGTDSLSIIEVDANNPTYDSRNYCNSIISTGTNRLVTGCMNSVIPEGIQSIGWDAFYCCINIKTIHIPTSVSHFDGPLVFAACSGLEEITVDKENTTYDSRNDCNAIIETENNRLIAGCMNSSIPEGITIIGDCSFYNQYKLTGIVLPESLTTIESDAFNLSGLRYVNIPENVTTIEDYAFGSCYDLDSIASYIRYPFAISNSVFQWGNRNKTLCVPNGTGDLYRTTDGWKEFSRIVEMPEGTSFALIIVDEDGRNITGHATITWYDSNENYIGTGNTLGSIEDGTVMYFSITLDEEYGRKYREIEKQKITVDHKGYRCQLERIDIISLKGRVSAIDIEDEYAYVEINQKINGKYDEYFFSETDEKGEFEIDVYDDDTEIAISRDDCFTVSIHRNRLIDNADLGTIHLSLVYGSPIRMNITYHNVNQQEDNAEGGISDNGLGNIDFIITNETRGREITDYSIKGSTIYIKDDAEVGEVISFIAKSKTGDFVDATSSIVLSNVENVVDLELTELGGIKAKYTNSSSGNNDAYLYYKGVLVARASYIGQEITLNHLPAGKYTLISMVKSQLLGNVANISDFNTIGFEEGKDYVETQVDVTDGTIASVNIGDIPAFDETPFYYTSKNTYFNSNKSEVVVGHYLTLSAHIELKDSYVKEIKNAKLFIDLPEDCQMVKGSALIGKKAATYTQDGNRITIPLTKENYSDKIRFCIIPITNRDYSISAAASLDLGNEVVQPIGIAQFTGKGFSINVPSNYASTQVLVSGTALGQSEVKIYDNDVMIGYTESKLDGSWSTTVELDKPFNPSYHDITAKIRNNDGLVLTSETKQLLYDKENIIPNKVVMSFYNEWYKRNIEVVFDLINGTTTPSSYPFYHSTDFTFVTDFTLNDTTRVKNVNFKVLASDGTIRTIPGIFNSKKQAWVGTTTYSSSNKLPQNVTMEYDVIPVEVPFDPSRINDDNNQFINLVKNYITNVDSTKFEILEANESLMVCKYQTNTMDYPVCIKMEKLDYNLWIENLEKTDYFTINNNGIETHIKDSISENKNINWIWTNNDKQLLQIEIISNSSASLSRATRGIPYIIGNTAVSLISSWFTGQKIAKDYQTGLADLQYWLKRYNTTITAHFKLYNETKALIEARCEDGSFKVRHYDFYKEFLQEYFNYANEMRKDFQTRISWVERDLVARRNSAIAINAALSIGSLFLPKLELGSIVGIGQESLKMFGKTIPQWLNRGLSGVIDGAITNYSSSKITSALDWYINNAWYTSKDLNDWYVGNSLRILNNYSTLKEWILNDYKKCGRQKEEMDDEDKKEEKKYNEEYNDKTNPYTPEFNNPATQVILDPSGYVYEAVQSNRLEDVTVTVYKKEQTEDMYGEIQEEAVIWDAEAYSQKNPLITDAAGFYSWDVPQGEWQVKYEKEGYETTYSDWLPVPPPQLDVNVGMKQSTPPSVKQMRGYESGITIDMSKYMRPTSLNKDNIIVTCNGMPKNGNIELTDSEKEPYGEAIYASKMKFVPETPFSTEDDVIVTVLKEVESYCGVNMEANHVENVKIEPEIKEIVVDSVIRVPYQNTKDIQIVALPKSAAANKVLHIKSSSSAITSISLDEIILDENGSATMSLSGELPGSAYLTFTIDDTAVTTTSKVKVTTDNDIVATPTASIKSGETVDAGTQITLDCDTEGSTIYYTLDGTCPCDETKRIKYDNPIVINSDVVIKAMAIRDDMEDSDIATFVYIVEGSGLNDIESGIKIWPYVTSSTVNIDMGGNKAETITVTGLNGMVVSSMTNVSSHVSIDLGKYADGIYIVNVKCKDDKIVRKIVKVGSGI